jgi:phosphatidylserine/phosphatidylglycerophosphate/cardiolipin synthase-like enzyme
MNQVLQVGRNCWNIVPADETGLLIDGCDYYRAFYQAAGKAARYILISGWQFDSDVSLLRDGTVQEDRDVPLLGFLNELSEKNTDLRIYILAWNFNPVYGLDREWFQKWYFNWTTNERLKFCFDSSHCVGASHHQKFAVVDGATAFLGGLDLCSGRWDDREHCPSNPKRINSDQHPYGPFHDIQSYHSGAVAEGLATLFKERWRIVCGDDLNLPAVSARTPLSFAGCLPLASHRVGISRTQTRTDDGKQESIQEIRQIFVDAITSAESIIYVENQYFSSNAVFKALYQRMTKKQRTPLQIILVLAKDANAFVEKVSIGIVQAKIIGRLRELAAETGHQLGVYYSACLAEDGQEVPIYIHSKLFSVDDRFLSVGSANMNNRSMGLDTEINVTWETSIDEDGLSRSIRDIRTNLLAEHIGAKDPEEVRRLSSIEGLVDYLDHLAAGGSRRLRRHPALDGNPAEYETLASIFPDGFPFDMEEPPSEQTLYETISDESNSFFSRGITSLKTMLQHAGKILDSR